jgi:hypothetical protein
MKIEVGKTYVTCTGALRRVISLDGPYHWPIVTVNECNDLIITYDKNGRGTHTKLVAEHSVWNDVKVDTPIWVRDDDRDDWRLEHFAMYFNGDIYSWANGTTSHSSGYTTGENMDDFVTSWEQTTLINPNKVEGK